VSNIEIKKGLSDVHIIAYTIRNIPLYHYLFSELTVEMLYSVELVFSKVHSALQNAIHKVPNALSSYPISGTQIPADQDLNKNYWRQSLSNC